MVHDDEPVGLDAVEVVFDDERVVSDLDQWISRRGSLRGGVTVADWGWWCHSGGFGGPVGV
jgi:hypothetical protein